MTLAGAGMIAVMVALLAGFFAYAVRGRSSQIFGPSVYHGDRSRPAIALTFDDGPSESTPELLALLDRHQVAATFFMCGKNVERLPDIARAVAQAGHEIGNHSDSHPRFDFCSREFIHSELAAAQHKIAGATGVTPRLFRAPYGVRWFGMRRVQTQLNLLGVMWTVIGRDWRLRADQIAARVTSDAAPGSIICLHDGRGILPNPGIRETLAALEIAIPEWKRRGLTFLTVSALIGS